jgi:peptide/nickel transport system ATP-binding protein
LLQLNELAVGYRNQRGDTVSVLRGVDLSIAPGETIGIVGESGSGKSTLALALMAYLRRGSHVQSGRVHFAGMDLLQQRPDQLTALRGSQIALIPQNAGQALTPTMRVGKQVEEALQLHTTLSAAARRERLYELLRQVRLPTPEALAQRYPHQLSGGQQQRVAIAMALAGNPTLLILDEPTTGLDVTTQAHILGLLRELAQTMKIAMVYVSHDLGVIAQVCDRVAVMYAGEIVETGPTAELLSRPRHPYTRGLLASIPRLHQATLPQALTGTPPAVDSLITGCAFAARCAWADAHCWTQSPLLTVGDGADTAYAVRCHHWQRLDVEGNGQTKRSTLLETSAADDETPLLRLEGISISYHKARLGASWFNRQTPPATVAEISLTIPKGKTLALVGESGSGKSTLLRAMAGLLTPQQGTITFDGQPLATTVAARPAEVQRRIQIVFQNPDSSLNPRHTVLDILAQPLRLYWRLNERAIRLRAIELLQMVRLGEPYLGRFPAQLSGGEKQRVAIARAFAAQPDLILCDEITASLDVSVQAAVLTLLRDLQATQKTTIVFISHDLAVVRAIADEVAVLYQGRLCEVGPAAAIFAPPFHPYTATLVDAVLEPQPGRQLPTLNGREVNGVSAARGCPYQQHCIHHLGEICNAETPPWQENAKRSPGGHRIRCHLPWPELMTR